MGMTRIALRGLALLIVIPYIAILYLFWDQLQGKRLPLAFIMLLSCLGFYLVHTVFRSINSLLAGLEGVSRGKSDVLELHGAPSQMREMTDIINALNRLTAEFRENAAQLQRFIHQFSTLTELTEITAKIPDIDELLKLVLDKAMVSTQATHGTVMLLREDKKGLEIISTAGWEAQQEGPISLTETICGYVVQQGDALLVENIDEASHVSKSNDPTRYKSPSFLIMPLTSKSATIGVVCLAEKKTGTPFTEHDREFLSVMLAQIGFAVENARLLKQAREAASVLKEAVVRKDIQLRDAEKQILQAEKLSALGQLVAGVAHEINNPLTSVIGYAEVLLAMDASELSDKVRKRLKTILDESNRASKIVQNLLSFARAKKPEMKMANLNDVVQKAIDLRQYDFQSHGIQLVWDLDSSLPQTMLDADQIQQVVLNLLNNSAQALPHDGDREIEIATRQVGSQVAVSVADTGNGIPDTVIGRIFEPFFTTKTEKINSGLGLSISYGIVKRHGGNLRVESEHGKGTTMTVELPVVTKADENGELKVHAGSFDHFANLKAFVVDDEENIVELVTTILSEAGFEVHSSSIGDDTPEKIVNGDYDLVVCDLWLPGLDGRQIYRRVNALKSQASKRFIFITGDVADPETVEFTEEHGITVVAKPFTRFQILQAAYNTLQAAGN